jgi:hypothetical protein
MGALKLMMVVDPSITRSRGADDKTLIEMQLASNTKLERNRGKQLPIYQAASDAKGGIKVIIFFSASEDPRECRLPAVLPGH